MQRKKSTTHTLLYYWQVISAYCTTATTQQRELSNKDGGGTCALPLARIYRTAALVFSALQYTTHDISTASKLQQLETQKLLPLHVNIENIAVWTHSASPADRSTARLLSADWITTLFSAAAADIFPLVSSKIKWSSGLPSCAARTDLMVQAGLGECAALTEQSGNLSSKGLWAAESCSTKTLVWMWADLQINRPASLSLSRAKGTSGCSLC